MIEVHSGGQVLEVNKRYSERLCESGLIYLDFDGMYKVHFDHSFDTIIAWLFKQYN